MDNDTDRASPDRADGCRVGDPRPSRIERREKAVTDALRTLVRDLHVDRFGHLPPGESEVRLTLKAVAQPARNWDFHFCPALSEQVSAQIEDAEAGLAAYRRGRVYCFRCQSSACEHTLPAGSLCVFAGYTPTGCPEWRDLAQVLLEINSERVDRLFAEPSEIVTVVELGRDLRARQLGSFGRSSKTYSILGQVAAGYFAVPFSTPPPRSRARDQRNADRMALTFQVVETRGSGGQFKLELNAVGLVPGVLDLEELFATGWEPWVSRAYTVAARRVAGIERRAVAARDGERAEEARRLLGLVPGVLRRLSEWLERGQRQARRRTHHVEERRSERRPVHKALEDVAAATSETMFYDEKTGALIVCGDQGRAHAFSADGRHITSFVLGPGSLNFRLRTRRWRPVTPEEAAECGRRIQERIPTSPGPSSPAG